jgi:perosamine synthetase
MKDFIPLMSPDIRKDDIESLTDILKSGMLVQGKEVIGLEDSISKYINVKHAIAVSSGTSALHLSLIALGIGEGDEVIIPALSFIATANVIELVGAKPIFVDINIDSYTIDCSLIENSITSKTKAIMPVHEFGLTADMNLIKKIASKHGLFIIEDAACALGAKQKNIFAGAIGDIACFSFHPRKTITSGEGGLITTNNDSIAKKLKQLRNHGIEFINDKMEFVIPGFNYRMTDFQAALLNSMFKRFDKIISIKSNLSRLYHEKINNPLVKKPIVPKYNIHSWQTYHLLLDQKLHQKEIINLLKSKGIGSNYGAQCIPEQYYYKKKYNLEVKKLFPNATKAYNFGLAIPLFEKLNEKHIDYISNTINNFIKT